MKLGKTTRGEHIKKNADFAAITANTILAIAEMIFHITRSIVCHHGP